MLLKISEKLNNLMQLADNLGFSIEKPKITFNLKGRVAGKAVSKKWEIRLNPHFLENGYFEDMLNQTLPHEFAHLICSKYFPEENGHGPYWKMVMRKLGLKPERCHDYDTSHIYCFHYQCHCREHYLSKVMHNKVKRGNSYRCKKCLAVLTYCGE
jgi:SprT protein